ncbi:MAG: hypothetical protein KDD69_05910 [Bdellovibrionales bacterium]|nr:hypothetical protein [Bdellovibrionales bacterium]
MRCKFLVILALLLATHAGASFNVAAQVLTEPRQAASALKGLTTSEVEQHFGPPDKRLNQTENAETWSYGRSIVLFKEGRVTAWSSAGELEQRRRVAQLQPEKKPEPQQFSSTEWENPWTPKVRPGADEVVLELMDGKEKAN